MTTANPFGSRRSRAISPVLGFAPGMLLFTVFGLAPAVAVAYFALTDATGVPGIPNHFVGLANFRQFFFGADSAESWADIRRSLTYAVIVTVIQNALALGIAVVLNGRIRGRTLVRVIVFAPTVLGVTVTALIWQLAYSPVGGPAASLLGAFGVHSAFLGSDSLAFALTIGVQIWMGLGYSMVIFLAGLQAIPGDLLEAATVDGAGTWRRFWRVTWPLLAPSVTANILIAIIGSLQSYQLIYVLTGGLHNTGTLAYRIFQISFNVGTANGTQTQRFAEQGYGAAMSVIQFVIVSVIALIVLRFLRRREVQL